METCHKQTTASRWRSPGAAPSPPAAPRLPGAEAGRAHAPWVRPRPARLSCPLRRASRSSPCGTAGGSAARPNPGPAPPPPPPARARRAAAIADTAPAEPGLRCTRSLAAGAGAGAARSRSRPPAAQAGPAGRLGPAPAPPFPAPRCRNGAADTPGPRCSGCCTRTHEEQHREQRFPVSLLCLLSP